VFYLGFKVYPLHCVLATQARVCGPGCTGRTEPRGSGRADPNTNTRYTSYGFINIFLYIAEDSKERGVNRRNKKLKKLVKWLAVLMLSKGRTDIVYPPPSTKVVSLVPCGQINAIKVINYPRDRR